MIIGISGKAGSGKDTVGKIIQYLTLRNSWTKEYAEEYGEIISIEAFLKRPVDNRNNVWQIKKFADKMKQCVSLITGVERESLESMDVKNSLIGNEWGDLTYRKMLQLFGTEVGRSINENFWVNALFTDYHCVTSIDQCEGVCGHCDDERFPKWIITDVRFPNELDAIDKRDGICIRLTRNSDAKCDHSSETALDNATFDYIIENNGSIGELIVFVSTILQNEGIIA